MIRTRNPEPPLPEFTPVPRRKPQQSGWTPARQRRFIAMLAATGSVTAAVDAVGLSLKSVYDLRAADGAESFREAWSAALDAGVAALRTIAYDRAVNGVPEALVWQGQVTGATTRYDNRLLTSVLRQYQPRPSADAPFAVVATQEEPADVATRLWLNDVRNHELRSINLIYRRSVRDILLKLARDPGYLQDFAANWARHCDTIAREVAMYWRRVEAGPDGAREVASRIITPIDWRPLTESQRITAASALAKLAGLPPPALPPVPIDGMDCVRELQDLRTAEPKLDHAEP